MLLRFAKRADDVNFVRTRPERFGAGETRERTSVYCLQGA